MRELLQRALDALIYHRDQTRPIERSDSAIAALRAALAAPIPEPVAWAMLRADGLILDVIAPEEHESYAGQYTVPLYAAPPAAPADSQPCTTKPVVSQKAANLTDNADMVMVPREPTPEQIEAPFVGRVQPQDWSSHKRSRELMAENYRAMIAAAPAPVVPLTREQQIAIREAHCNTASDEYFGARPQVDDATKRRIYEAGFKEGWESAHGISTVVREPLTDDFIWLLWTRACEKPRLTRDLVCDFARAIERAHGIGGGGND